MAVKPKRVTRRPVAENSEANRDELVEATSQALSFAQQNRRALIVGGVLTLTIILGSVGLSNYFDARAATRSTAFGQAQEALRIPVTAEAAAPAEGAKPAAVASIAARAALASKDLQAYLQAHGTGDDLGHVAQLSLAARMLEEGKAAEAAKLYGEALAESSLPQALRYFALDGLAASQIASADLAGARKSFGEIATLDNGVYGDYAALRLGLLSEREGKKEEARKAYQDALERYATGSYRDEIQKRLDLML